MDALSRLAAAAGGGVTAKLGEETNESRRPKKRQSARVGNTRKQDADMRQPLKGFVKKRVLRRYRMLRFVIARQKRVFTSRCQAVQYSRGS
ncbi:hypothetical protein [Bradyrhizobium sp. ARR65]|uniref:hypothetical protein n=1 Tax=Bradyrhizobium sp. ARR65 TaxID=1040989 RepID=UPI0004658604|nr:hypothetical protein [Bradyrhizobium sp. ARR65]